MLPLRTPVLGLVLFSVFVSTFGDDIPIKLVFHESTLDFLGHVPSGADLIRVNDAGTLATCQVRHDGKKLMLINGREGPSFDWVDWADFGTDGMHVQYMGNRGGRLTETHSNPPVEGGQWFKVNGNQELTMVSNFIWERGEDVGRAPWQTTSTDGKKTATVFQEFGTGCMIVNGKREKELDGVLWPVFSPDGERLAYEASAKGKNLVVVDGMNGQPFESIVRDSRGSTVRFSPDSKHVVYAAQRSGIRSNGAFGYTHYVVLNGKEIERSNYQYDTASPVFSADSEWLAYGDSQDHTYSVVVRSIKGNNKAQSRSYDKVWLPRSQFTGVIH